KTVWIARPDDYVDALRSARVLVDPAQREARIVDQVRAAAAAPGGEPRVDPGHLADVACPVECPHAPACACDDAFLAVPHAALAATMEANQKFFPVRDADGRRGGHFIGIANIGPRGGGAIRQGYERVIRPRFADARFFFVEDMKQGLAAMAEGLAGVTYQA